MERLKDNLVPYFVLMGLCTTIGLVAFFLKDGNFTHLVFTPFYLLISHFILNFRISGKDGRDYWGYHLENPYGPQENKELIIQGKVLLSDLDEDHKEERFLRVADHSGKIIRKILIVLYALSLFVGKVIADKYFGTFNMAAHLIPFALGATSLLTTSYGQLLALPFLMLLISFTLSPLNGVHSSDNALFIFVFFLFVFAAIRLGDKLPVMASEKQKTRKLLLVKAKEILPSAGLLTALYLIFELLVPKSIWMEKEAIKESSISTRQVIHKINKRVGKKFNSPSKKTLIDQERLINNLKAPTFKANNFQNALKALESNLEKAESILNSDLLKNLPIPEMEKNILINTHREVAREKRQLYENLESKTSYTEEDVLALRKFFKKYKSFEDQLRKHVKDFPQNASVEFSKSIDDSLSPLNSGIKSLPQGESKEGLLEELEQLKTKLDLKHPSKTSDKLDIIASQVIDTEGEAMNKVKDLETIKAKTLRNIEEQQKPKPLLDPKILNKLLDNLKKLFIGLAVLFILALGHQLLSGDKIKSSNTQEAKNIKRKLLKKRIYASDDEEILSRYNTFIEGVRKIYFDESEPPPPKVLERFLKKQGPINKKALSYLTEVFSQSFYGEKKTPKDVLRKYRKAFRILVKGL